IIGRSELRASPMSLVATGFVSQRMKEQRTCKRIAGNHFSANRLEVHAGLVVTPACASGRKNLQTHRGRCVAFTGPQRVAGVTARVAHAFRQKDRLDASFVSLIVQLLSLLRGLLSRYGQEQAKSDEQQQTSAHG